MNTADAHILIIEDNHALSEVYGAVLSAGTNYRVGRVHDGHEALEYLKHHGDPDMMLLDLRMPRMGGLEFLHHFKPTDHNKTAIVVLSSHDGPSEIEQAYSLGVARYVLKNRVAPKDLVHIVQQVLSGHVARQR